MSTEFDCKADGVSLTRFFGGSGVLICVGVEVPENRRNKTTHWNGQQMIELTREQAEYLACDLMEFAQGKDRGEW